MVPTQLSLQPKTYIQSKMKNTKASVSDVETQMEWRLAAASCTETEGNPFKLDDSVLERTKT